MEITQLVSGGKKIHLRQQKTHPIEASRGAFQIVKASIITHTILEDNSLLPTGAQTFFNPRSDFLEVNCPRGPGLGTCHNDETKKGLAERSRHPASRGLHTNPKRVTAYETLLAQIGLVTFSIP